MWRNGIYICFMRSVLIGLFVLSIFVLTAYTACVKDKCAGIYCANGGVCVDAVCACARGYEGSSCEKKWLDKFTGTWQARDAYYKDTSYNMYTLQVSTVSSKLDTFLITGFADSLSVLCKRDSINRFSFIPDQKIKDTVYVIKTGYGRLDVAGGKVSGVYTFKLGDTLITTNFTWVH